MMKLWIIIILTFFGVRKTQRFTSEYYHLNIITNHVCKIIMKCYFLWMYFRIMIQVLNLSTPTELFLPVRVINYLQPSSKSPKVGPLELLLMKCINYRCHCFFFKFTVIFLIGQTHRIENLKCIYG